MLTYAISLTPYNEGNKHFPDRIRWAHAHPTWTYHALPFITDALLAKLDFVAWSNLPRVVKAIGSTPEQNPSVYMREDEDMLNILLWRYKKHKQWYVLLRIGIYIIYIYKYIPPEV